MGYLIYLVIAILCGLIGLIEFALPAMEALPDNDNMIENYKTSMLVLFSMFAVAAPITLFATLYKPQIFKDAFVKTITGT